jgi:hypothetical protein
MFSIERAVALLTPTVFAPLAALLTKLITVNLPGSHVTSGQLTALEITAFTGAVAMGAHWLQGQKQWRLVTAGVTNTMPATDRGALQAAASLLAGMTAPAGAPEDPIAQPSLSARPESAITPDPDPDPEPAAVIPAVIPPGPAVIPPGPVA